MQSKAFINGVRVGLFTKHIGQGVADAVRDVTGLAGRFGGYAAKGARGTKRSVTEFGRGFKRAMAEG